MTHLGILLGLLFAGTLQQCSALSCMECTDLPNPAFCGTVARCQANSSCLTRQYVTSSGVTLYSSACVSDRRCQAPPQRRDTHTASDAQEDSSSDLETCDECCNDKDYCNLEGCGTKGYSASEIQEDSVFDLETCDACCSDKDYCNLEGCGTKVTALQQRGPYCFKCNVEDEVTGCRTSTPCDSGQACFLSKSTFPGMYKTGCMPISNCNQTMDSSMLLGKRSDNGLSIALPHCCFGDFCNDIYKFIASPTTTVDGGWSNWGAWSTCSQTCQETRSRSCDNPAPRNGGAGCHGNGTESKACATITGCPVDGGWSNWGDWSTCSVTCGAINGTITRMRSCDNPPPKSSGATCQGMGQEGKACTATVASCAEAYCTSHNYDVVTVAGTSQKLCIKLSNDTKYWWYANQACKNTTSDNNAHLVSITTEEVNTAIGSYLHGRTGHDEPIWIGLYGDVDAHHCHWTWTDHSHPSYTPAVVTGCGEGGHHDHHGKRRGEHRCGTGVWGDHPEWRVEICHTLHRYLCEIPM